MARQPEVTSAGRDHKYVPSRIAALDVIRGMALIAMIAFHFSFDLASFRIVAWDFYRDPFWLHARTAILSTFLFIAGVSLVLAESTPRGRDRFWWHVARIAGCALLVSVGSYVMYPNSFIWFGVLHAIALSLVLIRPLVAHPRLALALGLLVIIAGNAVTSPWFDDRPWGWIGFATVKPITEDYVPLFPWTGVMLVGIAAGHALVRTGFRAIAAFTNGPRALAWLGRRSLLVYMIHQPLLIGALMLATRR